MLETKSRQSTETFNALCGGSAALWNEKKGLDGETKRFALGNHGEAERFGIAVGEENPIATDLKLRHN